MVAISFISIGTKKEMLFVLSLVSVLKQRFNECNSIKLINNKIQTNRGQKSNILFLQRHDQSQKFWLKLVENRQKPSQRD